MVSMMVLRSRRKMSGVRRFRLAQYSGKVYSTFVIRRTVMSDVISESVAFIVSGMTNDDEIRKRGKDGMRVLVAAGWGSSSTLVVLLSLRMNKRVGICDL
jgi:glycerate-2-kinase